MRVFNLDRARAASWLTEAIVRHEMGEAFTDSTSPLPLGLDYRADSIGHEDTAALLIQAAQRDQILTGPDAVTIEFEYSDDGDQGLFRLLLAITAPAPLRVAGEQRPLPELPAAQATGHPAALALLDYTVTIANQLFRQLQDYLTTTRKPPTG
ncbi:hypothetical protein [Actinomadura rupiterrae]|uniref:hypothetical protein n=1 Tax=Actinomadura rupiterrae TaxID=559627 RepID=UPI0020A5F888|nr:hypothetical protein [Actinomadura rupiterrae]MCP2341150.1 hypothetical protein [Actinomadura rupiterrae]